MCVGGGRGEERGVRFSFCIPSLISKKKTCSTQRTYLVAVQVNVVAEQRSLDIRIGGGDAGAQSGEAAAGGEINLDLYLVVLQFSDWDFFSYLRATHTYFWRPAHVHTHTWSAISGRARPGEAVKKKRSGR